MHRPVTSWADACTSQAYACMYCMHCPMTSQADACSYCMGSVVLILSQIYLYLQLLCPQTSCTKVDDITTTLPCTPVTKTYQLSFVNWQLNIKIFLFLNSSQRKDSVSYNESKNMGRNSQKFFTIILKFLSVLNAIVRPKKSGAKSYKTFYGLN